MRRKYNLYVNGTKITDGTNKIFVNGAECRRCLVNGVDIINNFAQLKLKITMTGSVLVFSEFTTGCIMTDERGFANWKIDNVKVEIEESDFRINSVNLQFYIVEVEVGVSGSAFYSPTISATEFPFTANNLVNSNFHAYGQSSDEIPYEVRLKTSLDITFLPTGQRFTPGIEKTIDSGVAKDTTVVQGGNITHLVEFKDKTITVFDEEPVEQY